MDVQIATCKELSSSETGEGVGRTPCPEQEENKKQMDRGVSISKIHIQKDEPKTFKKMVGKYMIVARVSKTSKTITIEDGPNTDGSEAESVRKSQLEQALAVNRTAVMNLLKKFYSHEVRDLKKVIDAYKNLQGDMKKLKTDYRTAMRKAHKLENVFNTDVVLNENPLGAQEEAKRRRLNLKILNTGEGDEEQTDASAATKVTDDHDIEAQLETNTREDTRASERSNEEDVDKESQAELPIQTSRQSHLESQHSYIETEEDPRGGFKTPNSYVTDSDDDKEEAFVEQQAEDPESAGNRGEKAAKVKKERKKKPGKEKKKNTKKSKKKQE